MSPLPPLSTASSWTEEIGAVAEQFMNATISLYDLSQTVPLEYDPETDTGGYAVPLKLVTTKARAQHLRTPLMVATGGEAVTTRPARFQIPLNAYPGHIGEGILLRVDNGGNTPALTYYAFHIRSSLNGSHAAVRTLEVLTEAKVVEPIA